LMGRKLVAWVEWAFWVVGSPAFGMIQKTYDMLVVNENNLATNAILPILLTNTHSFVGERIY